MGSLWYLNTWEVCDISHPWEACGILHPWEVCGIVHTWKEVCGILGRKIHIFTLSKISNILSVMPLFEDGMTSSFSPNVFTI